MRRAVSLRTSTSSHRHIFYGSKLTSFQTTNSSSHNTSIICTQSRYASGKASEFSNQLPTLHEENYHKLDARRKKLLYRSKERGMLETDLLLGTFALKHLHTLNETQLQQYEALLDAIDPDLYQWLTKKADPPPEYDNEIFRMVQEHLDTNPLGYVSTYAQTKD